MSINVVAFPTRQRIEVPVNGPRGANRLLFYGGIVEFQELYAIDNRLVLTDANIMLGETAVTDPQRGDNFGGNPFVFVEGVVAVALASIGDLADSDNVGWSVHRTQLQTVFIDPTTSFLQIHVDLGFQGEAARLARLSYHADVWAIKAPEEIQLRSFDVAPGRISTSPPLSNKSVGFVTVNTPPKQSVDVDIAVDSPTPGLVACPTHVTVTPNTVVANFDINALAGPTNPVIVKLTASLGGVAIFRDLAVGGT